MNIKYFRHILSALLCLTLFILSFSVQAVTSVFYDTDGHFAESYTDTLWEMGVYKGYKGLASPDHSITRGEFTALVARSFFPDEHHPGKQYFSDINKNHIFFNEIALCYENNIIKGTDENTFDADSSIKRGEIALILSRLDFLANSFKTIEFKDVEKNSIYYDAIKKLAGLGIINGYSNGTFKPESYATRGECAKMLALAMNNTTHLLEAEKIKRLSVDFVKNKYFNLTDAVSVATGSALDDLEYIKEIDLYIKKLGYNVETSTDNIQFKLISNNGFIAEAEVSYNITINANGNSNSYKATTTLHISNNHKEPRIYYFNDFFAEKDKINLTWFVNEALPSHSLSGLTHASPSWFQLSATNLGVKNHSFGHNTIKLYTPITSKMLDYYNDMGFKIWPIYKTDFTLSTATAIVNNQVYTSKITELILKISLENGFDGINIDFENMYEKDKAQFADHVKKLTLALHRIGMLTSVDITKYEKTSKNWSMCYDRDSLNEKSDYLALMAYDQFYASSKTAGPVSGIGWAEGAIKETLNETNNKKLILGIPYYVRYWETKNGKVTATKAVSMTTAQNMINQNKAQITFDNTYNLNKAYWYKGDTLCVMWIEEASSVEKRMNLFKKYNLAGVASWRQGFETADIWHVINNNLK